MSAAVAIGGRGRDLFRRSGIGNNRPGASGYGVPGRFYRFNWRLTTAGPDSFAKLIELSLGVAQSLGQAEDDLHAGEIHAQVIDQSLDLLGLLEVQLRIEPNVATRTGWLD